MNLPQRARKATGLDIEDFADLLGVHFREVEAWEDGSKGLDSLGLNLFRLIVAEPRRAAEVLHDAKRSRARLERRIAQAVIEHGHGPKHTITLKRLRELVSNERTQVGLALRASPEEVTVTLLELEEQRRLRLEAPVEPSTLNPREREAAIKHPQRGLLAYASPGPRFPRRV